jgi:membrane protein YfhO
LTSTERAIDRALARTVGAASLAALALLFWPALLRRVFVYADLGNFFLPMRLYLAESIARGVTPLWMPELFCGFYAHGEGQIGIFHPLRWLLYRLLPGPEAFNLECLLPFPLALLGMASYLRRLALPASAAWLGGAAFAFSSYLTLRLTHLDAIAVIAHLGWLLAAIETLLRERGRARSLAWVAIAALTGSQLLVGYPPAVVLCWGIALPCALLGAGRPAAAAPVFALATALGAGVLLGAIQLVPTWDHFASSLRADPSYDWRAFLSLHPVDLLAVVAPWRGFLELDLDPVERVTYFGAVTTIAAHWVWLRRRELAPWQPLVNVAIVLSCLALVLALGRFTPVHRYFLSLPIVGWLRIPARYTLVLYFTGALFTGIAVADLLRSARSAAAQRALRWLWAAPAASALVAAGSLAARAFDPAFRARLEAVSQQLHLPVSVWIALAPVPFVLAAALFGAAARGHPRALLALAPLVLADLMVSPIVLWWVDPPQTLAQYRASIAVPPAAAPTRVDTPERFGRFFAPPDGGETWRSATSYLVHGVRLVSGYAGLMPTPRLDYTKRASLRVAGAAVQLVAGRGFVGLTGALLRARLVTQAVPSAQPAVDIERIDIERVALVDEPIALAGGAAGLTAIVEDAPGSIAVRTHTPGRQLLVLAESHHPGWRASIDGAEVPVLRVNGDFIGVVVEQGVHELRFSFAPKSYTVGAWASGAGAAIVLAVALGARRR